MAETQAVQAARRAPVGFPSQFLKLFLELLPLDDRGRCACVSTWWRDVCRTFDWTRLDLRGLGPLFPSRLCGLVGKARGRLQMLVLTDTEFFGAGVQADFHDMLVPQERFQCQEEQRKLLLHLVNHRRSTSEVLRIELLIANRQWPFDFNGVLLLLAGAPNVNCLEVDLAVPMNDFGYYMNCNRATFGRLRVRRLVLREDGAGMDGNEGLRSMIFSATQLYDHTFLRCKCLVLQGYDFHAPYFVGDVDMLVVLRTLLEAVRFNGVESLELNHVWLSNDVPGWDHLYLDAWLAVVLGSDTMAEFKIVTDGDLMYDDHQVTSLCRHLTCESPAGRPFVYLRKFTFDGANIRPKAAFLLLRALSSSRVEQVTLRFNRLYELTNDEHAAYFALQELIESNNPTLKVLKVIWMRPQYMHLLLIYRWMRHNTNLEKVYVPFDAADPSASVTCECCECAADLHGLCTLQAQLLAEVRDPRVLKFDVLSD